MQNDATRREVLISSLREFGVLLLKISIEKSILAPQEMNQSTITDISGIVDTVIEMAFNDRDTRYRPLANYLWDSVISSDYRTQEMLWTWGRNLDKPHEACQDFGEEMKLTLARRIFDYYYGSS